MSAVVLSVEYGIGNGTPEPTLTKLTSALERAGAEVANVGKHILPKLGPVFEEAVSKQFDARGGGPQSGAWAPLSKRYAEWKAKHFPGKPILERTGALRSALTSSTDAKALRSVNGNEFSYGTKGIDYASYHQTGTPGMPQRPPFDFGPDAEKALAKAAMAGVREAIKEASAGLLDFDGDTYTDETGATFEVFKGARGGSYITSGGRRTYLKKDKTGRVIKRRFGGKG